MSARRVTLEAEVVVIGGGIAGASTAYHLARHGRQVLLLERGDIASEASGLNAGAIDAMGWGDHPDLQAHLTAGSVELFEQVQLDVGVDVEYRRSGALQAIHTGEQFEFARGRVAALQGRGQHVELLTAREARSLEPGLSPVLLGAMYWPLRAQADPVKATRAFAGLAARAGARLLTDRPVTAIAARPAGGYRVGTPEGDVVAGDLVLAAGAWCAGLGAQLGLDVPIVPVRGQMWATAALPPRIFSTIGSAESALAWHRDRGGQLSARDPRPGAPPDLTVRDGVRVTRHLYGRQRRDGEIVFGGDREVAGPGPTPDPAGIAVNRAHAAEVLPFLASLPIARTWAGVMPFPVDGKPLIGRVPGRERLWIVGGLASSGFGRGPMAGKLLADYLHTGTPLPALAEADPARCIREADGARTGTLSPP